MVFFHVCHCCGYAYHHTLGQLKRSIQLGVVAQAKDNVPTSTWLAGDVGYGSAHRLYVPCMRARRRHMGYPLEPIMENETPGPYKKYAHARFTTSQFFRSYFSICIHGRACWEGKPFDRVPIRNKHAHSIIAQHFWLRGVFST